MQTRKFLAAVILLSLFSFVRNPVLAQTGPPPGGVEGPHGAVPGFPANSCYVCHDIVRGATGRDAVLRPNEVCLGCHTDGPTFGTGDPFLQDRPNATPVGNHTSHVTGSTRFTYGDLGARWPFPEIEQQIDCTTCHDPHRTFDPSDPDPSTNNIKYIRDHTDDIQVNTRFLVVRSPFKELKVTDNTGPTPVEIIKRIDQDIIYRQSTDYADGIGRMVAETNVCEVCHTLTDHHQVDGTAPGGQSHFDGEDCTSCHTHQTGFAPAGARPLTGPHAGFGDPDCGACHDSTFFLGGPDNPDGRPSIFCATCHEPDTVAQIHSHTATGSTRFDYSLECTVCHDQHGWDITNIDGFDNLDYIKATIREQITVIDHTQSSPVQVVKTINSDIVFDSRDDFADGDTLFDRDLCVTCHTLTSHHQNDGDAPGGQSHFDGEACTTCHEHPEGFGPPGGLSGPPIEGLHAEIPGFPSGDCLACHSLFPTVEEMKANSTAVCLSCHSDSWTVVSATAARHHSSAVTGATQFDYDVECSACHAPHGWQAEIGNVEGTRNIKYVRANIDELITVIDNRLVPPAVVAKDIDNNVVFTATVGPGSFADGDANTTEDVCSTCHTMTNHHQNDGTAPGGQSHFDGETCTNCHLHPEGFGGFSGPHPQAETDCSNCHLGADGEPDLPGIHGNDCNLCHTTGFSSTFLGPAGTWNNECSDCHNSSVAETGNMDEPTNGHRCVVCHGEQRYTEELVSMHEEHVGEANCVVCHGFIPESGVRIGSGNRELCQLCHAGGETGGIESIHSRHTNKGMSCLECHSGQRPPVDTRPGSPVGGAQVVCEICHDRVESEDTQEVHKKHGKMKLDCGSCHMDGTLQDDRAPMPPIDDARRAMVNRGGDGPCILCHDSESSSPTEVHRKHVNGQQQWCYNCHLADDGRPTGDVPPITAPAQSCALCHENRSYDDPAPFEIHEEHSRKVKCYACHQTQPQLFDWPTSWLGVN